MEKKKNIVIVILSIVVVVLSILVMLFATNVISFNDDSEGISNKGEMLENVNKDWVDYLNNKNIVIKSSEYNYQDDQCDFKVISLSSGDVKKMINELSSKKITKYYYGNFPPTGTICSDRYMLEYDGNYIRLEADGYMWINDDILSNKIDLDVDNVEYAEGADDSYYVYKFDIEFKDVIDDKIEDNIGDKQQLNGCDNKDVFVNKDVDKDILNELYGYLGMLPDKYNCSNNRLSYNISNNDYEKNADMIISLYSNSYDEDDLILDNKEEIYLDGELCVFCGLIKKDDAERIYKFYNFSGEITDYFNVHSKYDDKYILRLGNTSVESMWNGPDAGVKHNVTSEYINTSDIRIIDKQVVSYYNNSFYDLKSYDQTVIYDFVKDNDGNYYLSNVNVK